MKNLINKIKNKKFLSIALSVLLVFSIAANVFFASKFSQSETILVKFKDNVAVHEVDNTHYRLGGDVSGVIGKLGIQVIEVPKRQFMEKLEAYSSDPNVLYAEPDFTTHAIGDPNDPLFSQQWGLSMIDASEAWDTSTSSSTVNIAILDTGVDQDHPDLMDKIVSNINLTSSTTVDDIKGHGTHVAGIAAAITNNGIGVAGVGYMATIMNVKVLNDRGAGTYSGLISGIMWATDNGAEIINMSLGGSGLSQALEDAINYAWDNGVVVVAAAGNYRGTTKFYPAAHTNCIAVAATDSRDNLAYFSTYGEWVDVAAPGMSIYSTYKGGSYGHKSGTSMASPFVGGLAALVFTTVFDSNGNGRINDEVRNRIETTCDDIAAIIAHGRINAAKAVGGTPVLPGTISGEVVDESGLFLADATVTDGTRTTTTDTMGRYIILNVPEGDYTLTASKEGYHSSSVVVSIISGENTAADFSLIKILFGSIAGFVTDEDGLAIPNVTVTDGIRTVLTDSVGAYTIENVPPNVYQVTASKSGYESSTVTVDVQSEETATASFSLTEAEKTMWVSSLYAMQGRNVYIVVRVKTVSGSLSGVRVDLEFKNGDVWNLSGITSIWSGSVMFSLGSIPVGRYTITVKNLTHSEFVWDTSKGKTSIRFFKW